MNPNIFAIVPAGGVGSRMNSPVAKQYLRIHGTTVIELTLKRLLSESRIKHIVVPISKDDSLWEKTSCSKDKKLFTANGGATRAQSVLNGLEALTEFASDPDWVIVHDAARPCLSSKKLSDFIDQLYHDQVGGILALPAQDTIKLAASGSDMIISETLERNRIWLAQTPQMFRYGALSAALKSAQQSGHEITDEASAMEAAGHPVRLVLGEQNNLKLTKAEDLELATFILKSTDG